MCAYDEEEEPTWRKPCDKCGQTIERWHGMHGVSCFCGAEYNAFGQRLRDDWRGNSSNWDEDVSDMDGYEMRQVQLDELRELEWLA